MRLTRRSALAGAMALSLARPARSAPRRVITYAYPRAVARSKDFRVRAGDEEQVVHHTSSGAFVAFGCEGPVEVEIEGITGPIGNARIAPARHHIASERVNGKLRLALPGPMNLLVEIEGLPHLFLFANPPERAVDARKVRRFRAGQVYEVGELRLGSGETLHIEGGAIVRGCVRATSGDNVTIRGFGILDGSYYGGAERRRSIVLEGCRSSRIEDVVIVEPTSWTVLLGACDDVSVRGVRELASLGATDGIDVVGCRHVRIADCFLRNGDDCIAIKSLDLRKHGRDSTLDYTRDVDDVEVTGCSFMAYLGGQAMEIGHELRSASVRNVRFRNCDVLKKPNYGAPFGIHNADRATVSGVLFEDVRVEHHYDKLVDFRVIKSRYSAGAERGRVQDVVLRRIDVTRSPFNEGYTTSVIGGYDEDHLVERVTFDDFKVDGRKILAADELDLYVRHARDVTFR